MNPIQTSILNGFNWHSCRLSTGKIKKHKERFSLFDNFTRFINLKCNMLGSNEVENGFGLYEEPSSRDNLL